MAKADGAIYINTKIDTEGVTTGGKEVAESIKSIISILGDINNTLKSFSSQIVKSFTVANDQIDNTTKKAKDASKELKKNKDQDIQITRWDDEEIGSYNGTPRGTKKINDPEAYRYNKEAIEYIVNYAKGVSDAVEEQKTLIGYIKEAKDQSVEILQILSNTEKSAKSKAASIASVYKSQGMASSDAFKKAWQQIERNSSSGSEKVKKSIKGIVKESKGVSSSLQSNLTLGISGAVKKIGALIGGIYLGRKLVEFGKESIELGSDLAEVQNVVDTVFPNMASAVDEFAKSAAAAFGLSETMAKQYAGAFGAMATSFGFTEQEAYNMSTALTGLAGDVASFYNITQDEAYTKLKSVFSGETETLKDLGVVMTQNALDAYALANGYGKTTSKMSEQEKVALRYRFVMEQLSTASGDFAKTSDSWANQTRLLKLQFDSLKATLGQGLINVFTPIIKVINTLLAKLTILANAFKSFTQMITGNKASSSSGGMAGVAADTALAADSTNALADATENAAEATKEAEKANKSYLSGLDEIKQYEKPDSSDASNELASIENLNATNIDYGSLGTGENVVDELGQKIKDLIKGEDWEGLGAYLASGVNKGLQKVYDVINWDNVGPRITYFVGAFTQTFNSLVDNLDWDLLGRTVGTGINTVVNTLNLLIEGIDWVNLGSKFSEGLNGLVDEVDWENLGRLIGNKFMILPEIALGFVKNLDWGAIGTAIGDTLNGTVGAIDLSVIGDTLGTGLTGIFQTVVDFSNTFDWTELGANIYQGINSFFINTDWALIGKGIGDFVKGILNTLITAIEGTDWFQIGDSIGTMIASIDWGGIVARLVELATSAAIGLVKAIVGLIVGAFKDYFSGKIEECGGNVILGFLKGILDAIVGIVPWIYENILAPFLNGIREAFGIHSPSTVMAEMGRYLMEGLFDGISSLIDKVISVFSDIKERISEKWEAIKTATSDTWSEIKDNVSNIWNGMKDKASDVFSRMKSTISDTWSSVKSNAITVWESVKTKITGIAGEIKDTVSSTFSRLRDSVSGVFNGVVNAFKTPLNAIIGAFNGIINVINGVISKINSIRFSISIPDWLGGGYWGFNGFNIPSVNRIPYLATGAVIPPNAPFMAVLGDQKRGTNIEAPLSTIEDAVENVFKKYDGASNNSGKVLHNVVQINRRTLLDEMIEEAKLRQTSSGRNPFELA